MDKEITIKYKPNIETLMKVSKHLLFSLPLVKFLPLGILFILLQMFPQFVGINPNNIRDEKFTFLNLLPIIMVIGIWTFIYLKTLSTMKKNILDNKRNFETQKIIFNLTSYIQEGETFKIESFWNETFQIKETKDWFLIYPKKNTALPIIKLELKDNQYNELKELFNSINIKKSFK